MVVTKRETLNHEDHVAQNAQVWKKCQHCPFSLFLSFFWWALWPLFYGLLWPFLFPHMGQCSNNDDHHTFNSKLRATMTLYGMPSVVYRGNDLAWHRHQWKHHASYLTIVRRQSRCGGTCHGGSCMAIYLGMTLKKPQQVGMVAVLREANGGFCAPAKVARH